MKIGIIGLGGMGCALAAKFVQLGHTVSVANSRGPESLQEFAGKVGAEAASVEDVIKNKGVIIISIPEKNIPNLPIDLFKELSQDVVIIETCNYYPNLRDSTIAALEQNGIDSLWVQNTLGFPVVKAFNSIFAESITDMGREQGETNRVAIAVSGDNLIAKRVSFWLINELGFDAFDIGTLAQSWKQQPGSPIYCKDITLKELKKRVNSMGTEGTVSLNSVIAKRKTDEVLMASDYPAYLKGLQD